MYMACELGSQRKIGGAKVRQCLDAPLNLLYRNDGFFSICLCQLLGQRRGSSAKKTILLK